MNELELLVPAYSNPANPDGSNMWNTLIETAATSDVKLNVILNPSSGPGGSQIDPNYIHPNPDRSSPLLDLENAGGVIYGYVATTFGDKPIEEVKAEIDRYNDPEYYYNTGFQLDGIFLDEMSNQNDPEKIAYYTEIKNYIKSTFPDSDKIIGNPGTSTIEAYVDTVDTLVTFENYGINYRENYNQPDWVENYSADRFAHLIHTESLESDMQLDVQLAKSRNVGMIYITDDVCNPDFGPGCTDNPWNKLATYWEAQSDLVLPENTAPNAIDDIVATDEDSALNGSVLADNENGADSDPDGDPLTVTEVNGVAADVGSQVTLASGALLTLEGDGTFNYDPNGQFESLNTGDIGFDSFTYTIDDGNGGTDTATVNITIDGVNDGPTPTSGDDDLTYTVADEIIDALAGDDIIRAKGGNDDVFGNDGNDRLLGQNGNDILNGGLDRDTIKGGSGNDRLIGGSDNDALAGGDGNDTLIGVDGDSMTPGAGERDVLIGNNGEDLFILGNTTTPFYVDGGNADRAIVKGFDVEVDTIQLSGAASDYELRETNRGHTKIFDTTDSVRELIAVVQDTIELDLSDTSTFIFV